MIIDHESVEDFRWHFKVVKCRNWKKKMHGKRIWSSSSRSDLHHVIKRSNDFHWLEFRWNSAYCLVHKICHMNPALTGKIRSCTLLCAGCMTLIHCNVTWYCVDIPIVPYVHTVPTYGREACEGKAMNQRNSNSEVIYDPGLRFPITPPHPPPMWWPCPHYPLLQYYLAAPLLSSQK